MPTLQFDQAKAKHSVNSARGTDQGMTRKEGMKQRASKATNDKSKQSSDRSMLKFDTKYTQKLYRHISNQVSLICVK